MEEGKHPFQEKEPLPSWPDGKNPNTGEVGGPKWECFTYSISFQVTVSTMEKLYPYLLILGVLSQLDMAIGREKEELQISNLILCKECKFCCLGINKWIHSILSYSAAKVKLTM